MKRTIALISLLLAFSVSPVLAQFGSGIVYDPTNYHNAVLRYLQLQKQLQQLQQSYNVHMQQFMFIQSQARQLQNMVARYRAIPTLWTNLSAANTLGNTSRWVNGINSGTYSIAQQGYGQINRSLSDPTGVNTYDGLKRSYGLEELSDGSTVNSMATIGEMRNHAQQLVTTERNRTTGVGTINTELYRQQHFSDTMSFTGSIPTQLQLPTGR